MASSTSTHIQGYENALVTDKQSLNMRVQVVFKS